MGGEMNVAAEIASLRGDLMTSMARMEGQLNLIVQTTDHTAGDVEELDTRVTALEARRVPWPMLASLSGVISAAGAVVAIYVK